MKRTIWLSRREGREAIATRFGAPGLTTSNKKLLYSSNVFRAVSCPVLSIVDRAAVGLNTSQP